MEPPDEWVVSCVCEAFGCLPSEALREIVEGPAELIWRILELRAFARGKEEADHARRDPKATIEEGPMRELVLKVQAMAIREIRAERRGEGGAAGTR